MHIALSFVICTALVIELVIPAIWRSYRRSEAAQQEKLFFTKLRIVRKYYPELNDSTYSEILAEYDVEALYNNLGRKPLKRLSYGPQARYGTQPTTKKTGSRRVAA